MKRYPAVDPDTLDREALLGMIDYTLLKPEETLEAYTRFIADARDWKFGKCSSRHATCRWRPGCFGDRRRDRDPGIVPVRIFRSRDQGSRGPAALEEGAREIDMVMNISAARSGEWEIVEEDLAEVVTAVREWEKLALKGAGRPQGDPGDAVPRRRPKREACRAPPPREWIT